MVIAFHFGLGVPRTVRAQVLQLVCRAALHPHAVPLLQGVLQAGVAIHDQQHRRGESSLLQIRDRGTPRRARLRGRDARCEQAFLPGFGDAQGGQGPGRRRPGAPPAASDESH